MNEKQNYTYYDGRGINTWVIRMVEENASFMTESNSLSGMNGLSTMAIPYYSFNPLQSVSVKKV